MLVFIISTFVLGWKLYNINKTLEPVVCLRQDPEYMSEELNMIKNTSIEIRVNEKNADEFEASQSSIDPKSIE